MLRDQKFNFWAGRAALWPKVRAWSRASSPNNFAGHSHLAQHYFWCSGLGLRVVKIGAFLHSKNFFSQMEKTETLDKMGDDPHIKKVPPRTNISWMGPVGEQCNWSLFWVSIRSSAACIPGSGRKEEPSKMEEPGLTFCRARFSIVLWTFCDFSSTFLSLACNQHLIAAYQCQNKSPAHFLPDKGYFPKSIS